MTANTANPTGPAGLPPGWVDGWCQHWRHRTPTWRHRAQGGFDPDRYTVVEVAEQPARMFTTTHHYAASWPAARLRYGLIDRMPRLDDYPRPHPSELSRAGRLVGVAVLTVPMHPRVVLTPFPDLVPYTEAVELGRLVLLDLVPGNAESWFLARAFRLAARVGVRGIVAFSDPVPRHRHGCMIMPGHVGWCYQGHNAAYLGRATARNIILLPDGTSLPARAAAKLTGGERGGRGVAARLARLGAPPPDPGEVPARWLDRALDTVGATRIRHPGNHRYAWRLRASRGAGWGLPVLPYPKAPDLLTRMR
jgi:hypothetical protein